MPNALATLLREIRPTLALAFPIILGMFGIMAMFVIDGVMLARVGVVEVAASTFASSLVAAPLIAGFGLNAALTILTGRALGAGDHGRALGYLRTGWLVSAVYSIVIGLAFTLGQDLVFWAGFRQDPLVAAAAHAALPLYAWLLLPTLTYQAARVFCDVHHRPWIPLGVLASQLAFNVLGNWIFIFGNLGAPALGVQGAALATLIARTWGLFILATVVLRAPVFRLTREVFAVSRVRWADIRGYLSIGIPTGSQTGIEHLMFVVLAVWAGQLSAEALAAHTFALRCAGFSFMLPLGLSFATTIRISRAMGQNDRAAARRIGLSSLTLSMSFMLLCALFFVLSRDFLPDLFFGDGSHSTTNREAVLALSRQVIIVAALFQVFDGAQIISVAGLRGMADVRRPTLISLGCYWGVALPVAYLLAFQMPLGLSGLWWGLLVAMMLAAGVLLRRFLRVTGAPGS